jgi:hypothetical protein
LVCRDSQAVLNPGDFELDGNATQGNIIDIISAGTNGALTGIVYLPDFGPLDKDAFIPDYFPGADDQPSTGATKDTNDIDVWDCKSGVLSPPKNDMANAFFASYTIGDNQIIYFGLDRINSDNGNANVGFWLLKDQWLRPPSGISPAPGTTRATR